MESTQGTLTDLIHLISQTKGAKFASFIYTSKGTGEKTKITIILGASTETLYKKDIAILEEMLPTLSGIEKLAAQKILASRQESLEVGIGNNSSYTCAGLYVAPEGLGIDVNIKEGTVSVCGLVQSKTMIEPGVYKTVNHRPLTIAKNKIEKGLKSNSFRRYLLSNVTRAALNGDTLEIETEPVVNV